MSVNHRYVLYLHEDEREALQTVLEVVTQGIPEGPKGSPVDGVNVDRLMTLRMIASRLAGLEQTFIA
jgi:hypothetical protein